MISGIDEGDQHGTLYQAKAVYDRTPYEVTRQAASASPIVLRYPKLIFRPGFF